ncbi:MAG: carboxylesterase/lipase family protein [Pseudomonadota bacterium]
MTTLATRLGKVRGLDDGRVKTFLGVPYAEPPVGERRFKPPVMVSAWDGTRDATRFPNRAMQSEGGVSLQFKKPVAGELSEDCLYLNIDTPSKTDEPRPVLFWIHGGAFVTGSANEYDGSVLAAQGDVVVVTVNFRLGAFGFMDVSELGADYKDSIANGVLDLILSLQWVQENIADYGGDPDNVTIFGESSGGSLVMGLLGAPSADRYYHKAIAHSATCAHRKPGDRSESTAKRMGVSTDDYLQMLLEMPAQDIIDLDLAFGLTVDGNVITRSSFDAIKDRGANGVPLITGTNQREGTLYTQGDDAEQDHYANFNTGLATEMLLGGDPENYLAALRDAYPDASPGKFHELIWTDMFRRICSRAAEAVSSSGPGAWLYRFDLPANRPGAERLGATHASELAFTFNTFAKPDTHASLSFHDRNDPVVQTLAKTWSDAVIRFAKTGNPNGGDLPDWPTYASDSRNCLILDGDVRIEPDPDRLHRSLWEK